MNISFPQDDHFIRICRAVEYADEHLDSELSLDRLAEIACFSPRHFHRIFTAFLNETPGDYVMRLRLQKATGLILMQKPPTMTEVAAMCGFSTSALFSRNFARYFGASPSEWRDGKKRQEKVIHRQIPVSFGKDPHSSYRYLMGNDDEEVEIDIQELQPFSVHCVPYLYGYNEGVEKAFTRLIRWARPRGLLCKDARILTVPFDNPEVVPVKRCRNYAGIIPGKSAEPNEENLIVRTLSMPGGQYLKAYRKNPTSNLHILYRLLYESLIPELGFMSFGGRGFIEIPGITEQMEQGTGALTSENRLVYIPVRPAE